MPTNHERNNNMMAPHREKQRDESDGLAEPPHSIYSPREKWCIVTLIAFGGLFSPLSSNIYFAAISTLSQVFHKPVELINLTVTMYIIFQGLAPLFWGTLADSWGRRPMFIWCLSLLSIACVGLALTPANDYWLFLLLRCVQAAGSASTVALGAGVIGDISEPAERGGFLGVYNIGPLVGPAIGPVLGGALADKLGWRSIFWFLCISASGTAVILVLLLPETLRSLVGNGSIPAPSSFSRPIIPLFGSSGASTYAISSSSRDPSKRSVKIKNPLRLLLNLDIFILLFFNGLVYAVFYGVTASISTIFHETYSELNQTQLGLCFLAIGGGMLIGSAISGKLLNWDYQRVKKSILSSRPKGDVEVEGESFPIEKARMRLMPILVVFYVGVCAAYGWCIEQRTNIAGPLILLFGVGFFSMTIMNAVQTLILDLVPQQGSSVTACNSLVRCALSAAMVAVIQLMLTALGVGWTYVLLAALCVVASPLMWVAMKIGPGWRAKRRGMNGTRGGDGTV